MAEITAAQILAKLKEIAKDKNVRVLYTAEGGARGMGIGGTETEHDVRFIYAHEPEWYMRVSPRDESIVRIDPPGFYGVEFSGIDIRRAGFLLGKGTIGVPSMLSSKVVYQADRVFLHDMQHLINDGFRNEKSYYSYLSRLADLRIDIEEEDGEVSVSKYLETVHAAMGIIYAKRNEGPVPLDIDALAWLLDGKIEEIGEYTARVNSLKSFLVTGDEKISRIEEIDSFIGKVLEEKEKPEGKILTPNQVADIDRTIAKHIFQK